MEDSITLKPIGFVRNGFDKGPLTDYEDSISEIVLDPSLVEGLYLLEENSHILVVFWMNRIQINERNIMRMHPRGREELPLVGVFATRSPRRPNPFGIRAVRLLKIRDNVMEVKGLDALNGSPVLDIKPYSRKHDLIEEVKSPWWVKDLDKKAK